MDELTIKQACEYTSLSDSTIRRHIKTGRLRSALRHGVRYIPVSDLEAFRAHSRSEHTIIDIGPDSVNDSVSHDRLNDRPNDSVNDRPPTEPHSLTTQDVRFLFQVNLSWLKIHYIRKAGEPSLLRDMANGIGRGVKSGFQKVKDFRLFRKQ